MWAVVVLKFKPAETSISMIFSAVICLKGLNMLRKNNYYICNDCKYHFDNQVLEI
jgi:multisubunit Na+/H+ antiporter MnhE subunit